MDFDRFGPYILSLVRFLLYSTAFNQLLRFPPITSEKTRSTHLCYKGGRRNNIVL